MISVDNLTVSFGGWDLFKDISLLVNPKDRIGLVGKNGAGKSTLLKVIAGEQPATSGTVTRSGDVTVGYLPQQMKVADTTSLVEETAGAFTEVIALEREIAELTDEIAVRTDYESADYEKLLHRLNDATDRYHILGGDNREAEIEKTLLGLGFRRSDFDRPTSEFSGGWRMRIELAKLLLRRPSVFLLDEPTNHLDIESIQWLEGYLKEYNGAVVLISHDRAFLDNVTNRTVEIMLGKLYDYKVPYSRYVELRRERRQQQMAAYENQQRMIEKTEEFIEKFRYKPTKSNQVQSRIKQLEKLDRIEVDEEDLSALSIKFPPAPRSGQIVAEVKGAGMSFGEKHVFSGAEFTIEKGDRIALVGRNGEGKTTFARMLVGELRPTEGSIRVGVNVNTGYYAQNQDDLMNGDFTVYDTLDRVPDDETPLIVVFDGVTDVRNFGAIARSAECAGAHGLIVPMKNAAPVNAEAVKASAGALNRIPVHRAGSIRNTLKYLSETGMQIVAATEKSRTLIYDADLGKPTVIVMGSEDKGISKEVLKLCDVQLAVPIIGSIESLNVSAAAAVLLFEAVRQRIH